MSLVLQAGVQFAAFHPSVQLRTLLGQQIRFCDCCSPA